MTHPNATTTTVFRTVEVGQDVPVTLGEPLSSAAKNLMTSTGTNMYRIKPGDYAGAEEIDVQLTTHDGPVHRMDFKYDDTDNQYAELLQRYTEDLGPPTSQHGGAEQVATWEDDRTEFQLVKSASGVRSMLRDRTKGAASAAA